jgi:D-threo-aldose 1-dehydrogenase
MLNKIADMTPAPSVTSRVGFGGSNLLGDKTRSQGLALLEAAYAGGIRHFDVAPAYGYGDAEALVGEFARDKRDKIVIATKFGLQPMKPMAGAAGLVSAVRKVMRASPWVRGLVRRNAKSLIRRRQFDVKSAQLSLENSLRALRTEIIDIYLMHECTPPDCSNEVLGFLHEATAQGKIRHFGIGTEFAQARAICSCCPEFAPIVQMKSSVLEPNLSVLVGAEPAPRLMAKKFITHGSFTVLSALRHRLDTDRSWAQDWNRRLDLDLRDEHVVSSLVLQQALRANPEGVVLFQSGSLSRVVNNIRAASAPRLSASQLDEFELLGSTFHNKRLEPE